MTPDPFWRPSIIVEAIGWENATGDDPSYGVGHLGGEPSVTGARSLDAPHLPFFDREELRRRIAAVRASGG